MAQPNTQALQQSFAGLLTSNEDPEALFDLQVCVGSGAHGSVHRAKERKTGRTVAVKKMQLHGNNLDLIKKEIILLSAINSEYCVQYLGSYFKAPASLFVVMEFFEGGSIGDILTSKKKLTEIQIASIFTQILPAVQYLHQLGKIHRDIKGVNILLNKDGVTKLADFGIAAEVEQGRKRETQIGSPFWMAPEIIIGEGYDQKVDIWAIGMTAIELAEFEHPFFALNPMTAMFQIVSDPVPKLQRPEGLSREFLHFIDVCLTKDPEQRPGITDLATHPFMKKIDFNGARQHLLKLFQEVSGLPSPSLPPQLQKPPSSPPVPRSNAEPPSQTAQDTSQGIVRFYMPDKSYRSFFLKKEDTAKEACASLRLKVGLDDFDTYSLYRSVNGKEVKLEDNDKPLQIVRAAPDSLSYLIFKPTPDTKAWEKLDQIFANLKKVGGGKAASILRSPADLKLLIQVVLSPNLAVVEALCEVVPDNMKDALVQALIPLFESQRQTLRLVRKIAKKEMSSTEHIHHFLRGGTLSSKMMAAHARLVGVQYLKNLLTPLFERIYPLKEPLELDVKRFPATMDLKAQLVQLTVNIQKLQSLAKLLVDAIVASIAQLPPTVSRICKELQILSSHYFRFDSRYMVPFSFIIGQLICPALVSPRFFGVVEEAPPPDANRTLILLSKTLQGAASGKPFETEDYMSVMNVFLTEAKPQLEAFFDQVLKLDISSSVPSTVEITPLELQKSVVTICTLLEERRIEVGKAMRVLEA